ncbi:MAG: alkaline phosphatase [Bacteroidota bacterium]
MLFRYVFLLLLGLGLSNCRVVRYETVYRPISPVDAQRKPQRVILMIGDGMGLAQITASMYRNANQTPMERFPVVGLQKCHSTDALATDSAAAATAMACGVKTFNSAIGVDVDTLPRTSVLVEAERLGWATGIVTTSSIVHATPAAFYAHESQRYQYENIAEALAPSQVDLAIGGGKKYFDRRKDERDLVADLRQRGYTIRDYLNTSIRTLVSNPKQKLVYFTADSEPLPATQGRDYLPAACQFATRYLSKRDSGRFFLLIEGAQIDWSGHARNGTELLAEIADFEKAVQKMLDFAQADGETLLLVTADHETGGMTISPQSTKDALSLQFATNAHTAQMVPLFAFGPGASYFSGVYDNTEIYQKLRIVMGLQP